MLQVLLNAAFMVNMLERDGTGAHVTMTTHDAAMVRDPAIVVDVFLDWRIWAKADASVWTMLFSSMATVIREGPETCDFNIAQFKGAHLVHKLLYMIQ
ncbi:PREDICTED: lysosomal-trafficking regulator-like, partial [Priapulus caudatus]|uniref:Lysosomal-trafficking regulator-like n=1 Tax=Priapulus caudatus TaxID=37621 RepID=A0ABM1F7N6_PRICU